MPIENRSSKTEMVSVPPYIGREPLVGRYYPAQCRRCGWVGSSEELTEDDAQCTRDIGDRLCLGDCDELGRDDLLSIIQAMAQPAPQPHPDPIAWMVGTAFWWTKEEAERDAEATGLPIVGLGPMPDAGEAARLRIELGHMRDERDDLSAKLDRFYSRTHGIKNLAAIEELSDKLADRDALLTDISKRHWSGVDFDLPADLVDRIKALSASAEPSAPAEHNHEIPGTSYQRLNALANQGE